mmetsp:Transcript_73791/g.163115  ORF Transcript_73791/g.163115 Transcript_73791/m.163115 type:complete len:263 (+) Transcript_73791:2019-2807(+)
MSLAILHKLHVDPCVQEHLCDHELGASITLLLQIIHLLLIAGIAADLDDLLAIVALGNAAALLLGLGKGGQASLDDLDGVRVALRVTRYRDGEVVAVLLTDVLHEVQCATEAALGGFPLLRATRGIPSERNDVAHTDGPALLQGLPTHLLLLIRAGEMHVGDRSEFVLGSGGELQGQLGRGAARAPGEVCEKGAQGLHLDDALLQVRHSLGRLRREILKGEPARRRLRHEVRDLLVVRISARHLGSLKRRRGGNRRCLHLTA